MSHLVKFFKKHIKGTKPKEIVREATLLLCNLTFVVKEVIKTSTVKVHMHSKTVKKLYDKRPANEFDEIIMSLPHLMKFPEYIYKNKLGREGVFLFVRIQDKNCIISSVLPDVDLTVDGKTERVNQIVTVFRNNGDYLKSCTLLWSWKGGTPSS